eukprot:3736813-Rhodomonas_salina.2
MRRVRLRQYQLHGREVLLRTERRLLQYKLARPSVPYKREQCRGIREPLAAAPVGGDPARDLQRAVRLGLHVALRLAQIERDRIVPRAARLVHELRTLQLQVHLVAPYPHQYRDP